MKSVARCEKCGREFVTMPQKKDATDPFLPRGARRDSDSKECGGRIVPIEETASEATER